MPNHVTNILTIHADSEERLSEILTAIAYDEIGLGTIDFNKINPMPPELDIESGSRSGRALKMYQEYQNERSAVVTAAACGSMPDDVLSFRLKELRERFDKQTGANAGLFELGKQCYENIEKHGFADWYSWRSSLFSGWGTKWNSYGYDEPHVYDGGNRLEFQTAWNRPEPVIVRLSKMYPDARFQHAWADEDIGVNVGEITYQDGEESEYDVPIPQSKEAYEMAADIWGEELSDYGLFYSEDKGTYVYYENDFDEDETEDLRIRGGF
jgi:hypothetical protein